MNLKTKNSEKKVIYLFCFVIFILLISAYSNSLYSPFTLDDGHSFVEEPKVLSFTFTMESVYELSKTKFGLYRFLPIFTFALDLQWGGGAIIAFHITNIVIHILASAALLFLLTSLFSFISEKNSSLLSQWQASPSLIMVFTVGLWALNPVQTNAVTYLVQRMTSMATLFCFLALGGYLRGRVLQLQSEHSKKVIIWYIFSFFSVICGFLCKEITAILPALVLLIEFLFANDGSLLKFLKKYKKLFIFFVLVLLPLVIYKLTHGTLNGYNHRNFTLIERLLTELRIVSSYIFLLLLPLPQLLNFEYDPVISTSLLSPTTTITSLFFLLFLIIAAWCVRKKYPMITFCIFWFFLSLLIESTIIPLELRFDHRLYMPSAGFYLLFVLFFCKIAARLLANIQNEHNAKILLITIFLIILSSLSLMTYKRNMVWQDSVTLQKDCVKKSPFKPRAHGNLARALGAQGKYKEAIAECEKALSLGVKGYEEYWTTANNLIVNLSKTGDNPAAIKRGLRLLAEEQPGMKQNSYPIFLHNLGGIYLKEAEYQKAYNIFLKGLKFASRNKHRDCWRPYLYRFSDDLLLTLTATEKKNIPLDLKLKSLFGDGEKFTSYEKLAAICCTVNEIEQAVNFCKFIADNDSVVKAEILRINNLNLTQSKKGTIKSKYYLNPFANKFNFYMATTYGLVKAGFPNCFLTDYFLNSAERLQQNNIDVWLMRSWLYYQNTLFNKAIEEVDKAIAIDNKYAQLWINRGIYCIGADKNKEALEAFSTAQKLYPDYPKNNKLKKMIDVAEFKLNEHK